MNEPYVPTGEEFDEGNLPQRRRPKDPGKVRSQTQQTDKARRVREFVLEVSSDVDGRPTQPER